MTTPSPSVLQTLWSHRSTGEGRVALWGSAIQLPVACYLLFKAWLAFPQDGSEPLLMAGLFHLALPVALLGTYARRASQLHFQRSTELMLLLLLMAAAPFAISLPLLK